MVWSSLPSWGAGPAAPRSKIFLQGVLSFVLVSVIAVWYYFWQKRRAIWQRVVVYALEENLRNAKKDEAHLETRFGSRHACNVVASAPNFRDFCCSDAADVLAERSRLRTSTGDRLAAGKLFRSSNLHSSDMSAEEFRRLKAKSGFVRILDLRNLNERREDGEICRAEVGEKNLVSVSLFPLTLLLSLVDVFMQVRVAFLFALRPTGRDLAVLGQEIIVRNCALLRLRGIYLLTLEYNQKLVLRVLQEVTREASPLVLQCGTGKDSTGLIVALLMVALNLAEEDIVYSYQLSASLLSTEYCSRKQALFQNRLHPDFFTSSSPHVMESVLQFLKNKYGSPTRYLDHIGFNAAWRTRLSCSKTDTPHSCYANLGRARGEDEVSPAAPHERSKYSHRSREVVML
ncbi:unnamed protein product [Amoebophrya sp. A120]|nr:unnamed protein product [Amoebophrya sp. A120]|eukprot:GSA120T00015358001.1